MDYLNWQTPGSPRDSSSVMKVNINQIRPLTSVTDFHICIHKFTCTHINELHIHTCMHTRTHVGLSALKEYRQLVVKTTPNECPDF